MHLRLSSAEALLGQGKHDEATAALTWLWENMVDVAPEMAGVRASFMAHTITDLVRRHPPARRRFAEIRDRAGALAVVDSGGSLRWRADWIILNEILNDDERTLTWFDRVKDDGEHAAIVDALGQVLLPLLKSTGRVRDIGRLFQDPVAHLIEEHACFQPLPDFSALTGPEGSSDMVESMWAWLESSFRSDAALLVTGLLAAGRMRDAREVAGEAVRLDPSDEMAAAIARARGRLH
jgi:hypothetical protein